MTRDIQMPYFQRKPYAETVRRIAAAATPDADILGIASRVLAQEMAPSAGLDGPFRLRRPVLPGQSGDMVLTLEQDGMAQPRVLPLACSDLIGPSGRIAAARVTLDPATLVLRPGVATDLRLTVAAPAGTVPGLYVGTLTSPDAADVSIRLEVPVAG